MFRNFIYGILIGVANIIPGVSGGTIAVVLDIYEPLIKTSSALTNFKNINKKQIAFLSTIGGGAIVGIIGFSHTIELLLTHYPIETQSVFAGLVFGTIPLIIRKRAQSPKSFISILFIFVGLSICLLPNSATLELTGEAMAQTGNTVLLFMSGMIGAATMVIPGISGSLILVLMGTYTTIIQAISNMEIMTLFWVAMGAVVGIIIAIKAIAVCLRQAPGSTYSLILGLLGGAFVKLMPEFSNGIFSIEIAFIVLGTLTAHYLRPQSK
jgi:putative membrane protein